MLVCVICFVFGCTIFSQVHLREYPVFLASLIATLVELYEPFGINDNVAIPVLSAVALQFVLIGCNERFQHIQTCTIGIVRFFCQVKFRF